jgi:hypothetical protein
VAGGDVDDVARHLAAEEHVTLTTVSAAAYMLATALDELENATYLREGKLDCAEIRLRGASPTRISPTRWWRRSREAQAASRLRALRSDGSAALAFTSGPGAQVDARGLRGDRELGAVGDGGRELDLG